MNAPRPLPGFTLIETMVSLVVAATITAVALDVLLGTLQAQREVGAKAKLARDAQLVVDRFTFDTAYLGAGIPRGFRADPADFTGGSRASHQLRPPIRIGRADNLVFVGDLPFENADLPGLAKFVDVDRGWDGSGAANDQIMVSSELCPCVPPATIPGSYSCTCRNRTLVGGSFAAADDCNASQKNARLCPWSLNKWQRLGDDNAYVVLGNATGDWHYRRTALNSAAIDDDEWGLQVKLDRWRPAGNTGDDTAAGAANLDVNKFHKPIGSAFVAVPDRVFWSYETAAGAACPTGATDCVIRRRQCWGRLVDPAVTTFPGVTDTAFRSTSEPDNCTAGADGTPWETLATQVASFSLRYFASSASEVTGSWTPAKASTTRLVELTFTLKTRVGSREVAVSESRRVYLNNAGGILGAALADGGCVGTGC